MEAKTFNQEMITELETSEGRKITGAKQILQEMKMFIRHYTGQNMLVHMNSSQTSSTLCNCLS